MSKPKLIPKPIHVRDHIFSMRLTLEEKKSIITAASQLKISPSHFVRHAAILLVESMNEEGLNEENN